MLALTTNGKITQCRAKTLGNGRCNHVLHQNNGESTANFINKVNALTKTLSVGGYRKPSAQKRSREQKEKLSGKFFGCQFVREDDVEELSQELIKQQQTLHSSEERNSRNSKVEQYEEEVSGKVQEMFIVDRHHRDGNELHVVKNNGIIEIYNIEKLKTGRNSLITKLIARPQQVRRYYTWCDCETPKYLTDIAFENETRGMNNW